MDTKKTKSCSFCGRENTIVNILISSNKNENAFENETMNHKNQKYWMF